MPKVRLLSGWGLDTTAEAGCDEEKRVRERNFSNAWNERLGVLAQIYICNFELSGRVQIRQ